MSCYQFDSAYDKVNINFHNRLLVRNQTLYTVQLLVPQNIKTSPEMLNKLYNSLSFTDLSVQRMPGRYERVKPKIKNIPPSKADNDPNSNTHQIKLKDTAVQISVENSNFVTVSKKEWYLLFTIRDDEEKMSPMSVGGPIYSNIPGEINIKISKGKLPDILQKWKKQYINKDRRIIKILTGRDMVVKSKKGVKRKTPRAALLLVGGDYKNKKPCVHRAVQFIQSGEYIITIDARCYVRMNMPDDYKTRLNNILQSAIKSIRINSEPVNITELAKHVKKN